MKEQLIIGSRGSRLALVQAELVQAALKAIHPQIQTRIEIVKTTGDRLKSVPLAIIGGQGVFTKELEEALLTHHIDLAVHSLKDLPTMLPTSLALAAITEREDARDCLVLPQPAIATDAAAPISIATLPKGARVGTSSPRRAAQVRSTRTDLIVKELRGNVDTRLRKLDAGQYDAIILAAAGLKRLGLNNRINALLESHEMLPAVAQGALGIETCADDITTRELLAPLNNTCAWEECLAERSLLRGLGGGCQLPIAAHAELREKVLTLDALVITPDGRRAIRDSVVGVPGAPQELGETLAARMLDLGAASLLAEQSI